MDKWISVKDVFPNNFESVLCINIKAITADEREPFIAHREESAWWCQLNPFDYNEYEDVIVTHWMPLPEPPEVKP